MSTSGWVTFWTAVGALGTVAGIFFSQGGSTTTVYTPPTASGTTTTTEVVEDPDECVCIGTVRANGYVYDDPCGCNEVKAVARGAKLQAACVGEEDVFTAAGRTSSSWYQVPGGYIPEVLLDTKSQFQPADC